MQFSSGVFLMLFLPITMLLYKIGGIFLGRNYKNIVFVIASFLFYAWGEPVFIYILFLGIIVNYYFGLQIEKKSNKKWYLICSMVINLGLLFVFKYLSFILSELSRGIPVKVVDIALPIGISFYTFQIMSYIFDVYYGKVPAQKNLLNLALYISMFPQLVAGPIVRYSDVEFEIHNRKETEEAFCQGIHRFVIGLAKKILLADFLGGIADKIFVSAANESVPLVTAWIGAVAFTFEIYYDFSGYSDMAIGLGKCFGFNFKENFNYPYISCSVTEFWKRWHISLTDWFRDYVYIPLGGNRVSSRRHILNLFIVWLLTGIWHGAEWTFVLWGMMYFFIQLLEKKIKLVNKIPKVLGYFITMFIVTIGWVIFKASNINDAFSYIMSMIGSGSKIVDTNTFLYLKSSAIILLVSYVGTFPVFKWINKKIIEWNLNRIKEILTIPVSAGLLGLCLLIVINGSYSPFIYFNF